MENIAKRNIYVVVLLFSGLVFREGKQKKKSTKRKVREFSFYKKNHTISFFI